MHLEVSNQLSNIDNLEKSFDLKSKQVAALDLSKFRMICSSQPELIILKY
jgi:hypothetical protein